jgi:hypothetical protein
MVRVYLKAREMGCEDRNVLQAALLHDSGKYDPDTGRYVSIPYRVAVVLLVATAPGRRLMRRLEDGGAQATGEVVARRMGWRYPFYLHRHHARLGAEKAAAHGASPEVVSLVAGHHDHDRARHDMAVAALQAADGES